MKKPRSPGLPPMSPKEARFMILSYTVGFGVFSFLIGRLEGLETRDAALKSVVLVSSALVGWGVLRLFGKLDRSWVNSGWLFYLPSTRYVSSGLSCLTYRDVFPRALAQCVCLALLFGVVRRTADWWSNRARADGARREAPTGHGAQP